MYSNVHGVSGAIIYSSCPNKIIGGILAFLSHFLLDYIGESGYGSKKIEFLIEGVFLLIFLIIAIFSKDTSGYFIGWILGNFPDLIDKRLFLNRNCKQYFSCHGFDGWKIGKNKFGIFSFNDWKLGLPIKIKLNKKETFKIGVLFTVLFIVLFIVKNIYI